MSQFEAYIQQTQAQLNADPEQANYWRGVRFGLELTLLEAQKRQTQPAPSNSQSEAFYDRVNQLVFEHLENLLAICQAPIKRDLLVYNAKTTRYELLRAIRHQANVASPSDYELQARPDRD